MCDSILSRDQPTDPAEPHVIRAASSADLVACAPAFVGLEDPPERSVVALFFVGTRTHGGMRVDLPERRRRSDLRSMARQVAALAERVPGVDGVAFVLYCDESYDDERGIPWSDLARELMDAAEHAGLAVKDAFCVASDGWGCYDDPISSRDARALEELDDNSVAFEARVFGPDGLHGSPASPSVRQREGFDEAIGRVLDRLDYLITEAGGDGAALDDADPEGAAADLDRWMAPAFGFGTVRPAGDDELVPFVERLLTTDAARLTGDDLGVLAWALRAPSRRDQTTLQIAYGPQLGLEVAASNGEWHARQRAHGGSMDDTVRDARAAGESIDHDDSAELLAGMSTRAPDRDRVLRGIRLLELAHALAPYWMLPSLGCMLAWLHWSVGRGSIAHRHVQEVLAIDADYGMGRLLEHVMALRQFPDWLFAEARSA